MNLTLATLAPERASQGPRASRSAPAHGRCAPGVGVGEALCVGGLRGRKGVPARPLTHHRAVGLALGTRWAHLEDPGAQQVGVGAVGRCVAVHGARAAEEQQEGGERGAGPGTHAAGQPRGQAAGAKPRGARRPHRPP